MHHAYNGAMLRGFDIVVGIHRGIDIDIDIDIDIGAVETVTGIFFETWCGWLRVDATCATLSDVAILSTTAYA